MGTYKEIDGDLITLAKEGIFDVIVQGNNCFCTQGAGLAPQFVKAFNTDKFKMEAPEYRGDINKLGTIDFEVRMVSPDGIARTLIEGLKIGNLEDNALIVVNAYTQYHYGANHKDGVKKPVDYQAITLVMRKINHVFKGKHIGLPKIGAGLAGGSWRIIKEIIKKELTDVDVTVVNYKP